VRFSASAQELPDAAQEELRQQARERVLRERHEGVGDVRLERGQSAGLERFPESETPCFPIKQMVLEGEQSRRFRWALKAANVKGDRALGRCLGAQGLDVVLARVHAALMARGYVTTQVRLPEQDLADGVLRLTLVPGRINAVRFTDEGVRTRWQNALPARSGDVLNLRQVEQALEHFQRVPTVTAELQLVPATVSAAEAADVARPLEGESDVVIHWQQGARVQSRLWLDDGGSEATGRWQGGMMVSVGNVLGWNEWGYVHVGRSLLNGGGRGTTSWGAHSSVPLGAWWVGANVGGDEYWQTVAGAFEDYRYSGVSRYGEVRLGRGLWRGARSKTGVHLLGWWRGSDTAVDDVRIAVQRRRTGGWEAGVSQRWYWGRSVLDAGLAYRRGTGALGALRAPEEVFGEGTSRSKRVLADARWAVPFEVLGAALRYQVQWRGQWNRTRLTGQERFAIGGRYTVRGFDDALLTGERGWWLRNELGWSFARVHEVYLGADYGRVGGAWQGAQRGRSLAGLVLGARGCNASIQWELFAGRPLVRPAGVSHAGTVYGVQLSSGC